MHLFDERLGALTRHPKMLGPVEQLLGKQVFVHQSRINIKQQNGSIVEWHQDWGTYHRIDGIPEPNGIMIGIFLERVSAYFKKSHALALKPIPVKQNGLDTQLIWHSRNENDPRHFWLREQLQQVCATFT